MSAVRAENDASDGIEDEDHDRFKEENPYVFRFSSRHSLTPEGIDRNAGSDTDDGEYNAAPSASSAQDTEEAGEHQEKGERGYVWYAKVMPDASIDPKHLDANGVLKARRPMPHIRASDLLANIKNENGRFILIGLLNGWPGLPNLQLMSITKRVQYLGINSTTHVWQASSGQPPDAALFSGGGSYRARFEAPPWSKIGWSMDSPGFAFWFYRREDLPLQMLYGEAMVRTLDECPFARAPATHVHAFAHRYPSASEKETIREGQTWHTAIFIEWSHGKFGTIVELGFLNGVGGYAGKSNWLEDKLAPQTCMDKAIPANMKAPWDEGRSEVRITDVPFPDKRGLEQWLAKYSETSGLPRKQQRFIEPVVFASAPMRLRRCCQSELAGFLLNYISRVEIYEQFTCNCQTFTADAFSFFCGKKDVVPYGTIVRPGYRQRTHSFFYLPKHMGL
eukprot:TRINITY_DN18605_c0_g1_i1.p1 TRINITY_DN18605_c0_g1~~TRINITY_DN18605_c0_g1_i1.p1  ORF type:complete len:472 (+),score=59.26 TRINITY_DN18605_c0_g1_i1:72-1418(+)